MLTFLLLSGAANIMMSLAWGTIFFLHRKKSQAFVVISLFYLCIALSLLKTYADYIQCLPLSLAFYFIYPFTTLSIAILFLIQIYYNTTDRKLPRWWYLLFLAPVSLFLVSGYVFYLHYPPVDISMNFYAIMEGEAGSSFRLAQNIHTLTLKLFGVSLAGVILVPVFFMIWKRRDGGDDFSKCKLTMIRFLALFIISIALSLTTIIYHFTLMWRGFTEVSWFAGIISMGLLMYKCQEVKKKEIEANNHADQAELSKWGKMLQEYFNSEEKPWRNRHLKIKDVANHLGTNEHTLSEVIRKDFQTNFNGFVKTYRYAEFNRLKDDENDYSLNEITEMAGFNSSSTSLFCFVKKETGMSPKRCYMKRRGDNLKM